MDFSFFENIEDLSSDELIKLIVEELNKLEYKQKHDIFHYNIPKKKIDLVYYHKYLLVWGISTKFGIFYCNIDERGDTKEYIFKTNIDIN